MPATVLSIESLRERIRAIEGHGVEPRRARTGLPEIDELVGGLPVPGIVELAGPRGSGRMRVAVGLAAAARTHTVAWVDPLRRVHPPGLAALGLDLGHTLLLRPSHDRCVWAVEQVIRSGCFPFVVVVDPPAARAMGARWARATEQGGCTLVAIAERPMRDVPATVRLAVQRERLVVVRDRQHPSGRAVPIRASRAVS